MSVRVAPRHLHFDQLRSAGPHLANMDRGLRANTSFGGSAVQASADLEFAKLHGHDPSERDSVIGAFLNEGEALCLGRP